MLRFFKAYSGQPRLAMVTSTLTRAATDLFHFMIVFMTIFLCYSYSGMFLFGRRVEKFSTATYAVQTCFNMVMGDFDWSELSEEHNFTAMMWFWSFMVLVVLVMMNMLLAIVMDVYTEV